MHLIILGLVIAIQLGILIHQGRKRNLRLDSLETLLEANSEESEKLSLKREALKEEQELYKQFLQDDKHRGEMPPKERFAEFRRWKDEKVYGHKSTTLSA